jgi:hypothetical protein
VKQLPKGVDLKQVRACFRARFLFAIALSYATICSMPITL